jgi:hypothetical protein
LRITTAAHTIARTIADGAALRLGMRGDGERRDEQGAQGTGTEPHRRPVARCGWGRVVRLGA